MALISTHVWSNARHSSWEAPLPGAWAIFPLQIGCSRRSSALRTAWKVFGIPTARSSCTTTDRCREARPVIWMRQYYWEYSTATQTTVSMAQTLIACFPRLCGSPPVSSTSTPLRSRVMTQEELWGSPLDDTPKMSTTASARHKVRASPPINFLTFQLTLSGNPWYLTTATVAQHVYSLISIYTSTGQINITATSAPFFHYYSPASNATVGKIYNRTDPTYTTILSSLRGWADAYIRTIKFHTPADGSLSEEFNRNTGMAMGAADLTWSYASLLSAGKARAKARGEAEWERAVAELWVDETNGDYVDEEDGVGVKQSL